MIFLPLPLKRRPGKIMAGSGLLSRSVTDGYKNESTVLYTATRKTFAGAWWCECNVTGKSLSFTVGRGFVNGIEPLDSNDTLISESNGFTAEWKPNEQNQMWVCVKVKVDEKTGKMLAATKKEDEKVTHDELTCVARSSPGPQLLSEKNLFGYAPLAMLKMTDAGILKVFQIAYFDYRHSTSSREEAWRHFFHVA